jgi:uncharacterized membrane protein YuzA (DUF378 family)
MPSRAAYKPLDWIAIVLMIIGGLNLGSVGLFSYDFVAALFGANSEIARATYVLVGLAALYGIYVLAKSSKQKPIRLERRL